MVQLIADRRDIDFVLYEQLGIEDFLQTEKFSGLNRKMFDMVISEARNFGIKELLPTCSQGDREGVKFRYQGTFADVQPGRPRGRST
jgi:hypothetical protein